ncbi:MAG: ABC transporter substrate-binding protein [Eubacteriales bacterium]
MKRYKHIISMSFMFLLTSTFLYGCGEEETVGREQIEIVSFSTNQQLSDYIYEFNIQQTKYEVVLTPLELTEETHTKLMIDIVGGNGPDIVNWGTSYNKILTAGDAFLDMSEYVNTHLSEEMYAINILNAFSVGEELKVLVANYNVSTMALLSENLMEIEDFNVDTLVEYYNAREDDMVLFMGETKMQVLAYLLNTSLDTFIDWESQSTTFDSETFQKILMFCNEFPNQLEFDDSISIREQYLEGHILMYPLTLTSVCGITTTKEIFGEQAISFIGYPTADGSEMICEPVENAFSVNSQCENLEGVYLFLDGIMGYEYQSTISYGYPVLNSVLEEQIEAAKEIEIDFEGNQVAKEQVRFVGEEAEDIYQITNEDADELRSILRGVSNSSFYDFELMQIVYEESEAFFQGEKTVEDVVKTIQNRSSLYIREQF